MAERNKYGRRIPRGIDPYCNIQPKDRPKIVLAADVKLNAVFGWDVPSMLLVDEVLALAGKGEVNLLETQDTIDDFKTEVQFLRQSVPGVKITLMEKLIGQATVSQFDHERLEWADRIQGIGEAAAQHVSFIAEDEAEVLATTDPELLTANKRFFQQKCHSGRILSPSHCREYLHTVAKIFQLNQGV